MNEDDPRQSLSALLDGECSGPQMQQAIDRLLANGELQQCWERFHLVSFLLRGEKIDLNARLAGRGVFESVVGDGRPRLGREQASPGSPGRRSIRLGSSMRFRRRSPRWLRFVPMTSALAAASAILAIFVIPAAVEVADTRVADAGNIPFITSSPQRWQRDDPFLRDKLDELLVSHHELTPGSGLSGFVSYVDFVGYEDSP